jgi:phage gp16-like protein
MSAARNPFAGYRPAKPARFDAPSQHRRAMIAKIKIGVKELGLCDDDYRAILLRLTGESSCAKLDDGQLVQVLNEFKAKGFLPQPRKAPPKAADHPAAMKARALWISLYHLNAISNPSEKALEGFATRQLKCARMQWADQGQMFKLIEALKAIAAREGWDLSVKNAVDGSHALKITKMNLLSAILLKLKAAGFAAESWSLSGAAVNICGLESAKASGPMFWSPGDLDIVARAFGNLLRTGERGKA